MSVKETARAEVIPTAETKEVAEMPRLISAELLMPAYMQSTPTLYAEYTFLPSTEYRVSIFARANSYVSLICN